MPVKLNCDSRPLRVPHRLHILPLKFLSFRCPARNLGWGLRLGHQFYECLTTKDHLQDPELTRPPVPAAPPRESSFLKQSNPCLNSEFNQNAAIQTSRLIMHPHGPTIDMMNNEEES